MKEFLIVIRNERKNLSPEEAQKDMERWGIWLGKLSKEGRFKGGDPLVSDGKVIKGSKKAVTDGPFAESKEIIGGYLIITAKDLDEATEITKDCPIYVLGGSTEIREIHHMEM